VWQKILLAVPARILKGLLCPSIVLPVPPHYRCCSLVIICALGRTFANRNAAGFCRQCVRSDHAARAT
jgi:hypothetical protein